MSATNAINQVVQTTETCPKPMYFYRKMRRKETGCEECGYQGWVEGPTKGFYTSVRRCVCMPPLPEGLHGGNL